MKCSDIKILNTPILTQARLAVSEIRRDVNRDPGLSTSDVDAEIKAVRAERKMKAN